MKDGKLEPMTEWGPYYYLPSEVPQMNNLLQAVLNNSFESGFPNITSCSNNDTVLRRWYVSYKNEDRVLLVLECPIDHISWYGVVSKSEEMLQSMGEDVERQVLSEFQNYREMSCDLQKAFFEDLLGNVSKKLALQKDINLPERPFCRNHGLETNNVCARKIENGMKFYKFNVSCANFEEQSFPSHKSQIEIVIDSEYGIVNEKRPELVTMTELISNEDYAEAREKQFEDEWGLLSTTRSDELVQSTTRSDELVQSTTRSDELVQNTTRSDELVQNTTRSDELVQNTTSSDELVQNTTSSDELVQNTTSSDELVQNTTSSDELVQSTTRSDELVQSTTRSHEPPNEWGAYFYLPGELEVTDSLFKTVYDNDLRTYTGCDTNFTKLTRWYKSYKDKSRYLLGYRCEKEGDDYDAYFSTHIEKKIVLRYSKRLTDFGIVQFSDFRDAHTSVKAQLQRVDEEIFFQNDHSSEELRCYEPDTQTTHLSQLKLENEIWVSRIAISCRNLNSTKYPSHMTFVEIAIDTNYSIVFDGSPGLTYMEKPQENTEWIQERIQYAKALTTSTARLEPIRFISTASNISITSMLLIAYNLLSRFSLTLLRVN